VAYFYHLRVNDLEPHGFSNLGGLEMPVDERDLQLDLGAATATTVPEVYMPDAFFNRPRVFYQRDIPDCGANAGAFLAAYLDEHAGQEYSPDYQWIDIKTFDGYALTDGTDMRSIFKSLSKPKGSLPYAMLPEQTTLPLAQFSSTNRVTDAMKTEAAKHPIESYAFHNEALTFDQLKALIYKNKAVVLLIRLGDEFWTDKNGRNSWAEKDILPLRSPRSVISGHFIVAGAFDTNYIYFANWWSNAWGRKGYGYFAPNYMPQIVGVGTAVDSLDQIKPVFTRDLTIGSTGLDVLALQKWLNTHGFVLVAQGPGSPGNESTYFGPVTQAAVARFQTAHQIMPNAGYFGPKTRAVINNL